MEANNQLPIVRKSPFVENQAKKLSKSKASEMDGEKQCCLAITLQEMFLILLVS